MVARVSEESTMRRTITVFGALVALALGAVPASAATAATATIEVHTSFEAGAGTFSADSDLLCASGTTTDSTLIAGNGRAITFHNLKTFHCADGSGTFTLRLQAQVKPCNSTTSGVWSVAGGTGAYEDLSGAGSLVGTYFPGDACSAEGIDDVLTGVVRVP
jgi:hypothetical protein